MQNILGYTFGIIIISAALTLVNYATNRSRRTLQQAAQLSGYPEQELRELITEGLLTYRRKYIFFGPHSLNADEIAEAHTTSIEIKRIRAENNATLRKMAEDASAHIQEQNRIHRETMDALHEEAERMEQVYNDILNRLRTKLTVIPLNVAHALQKLGLPQDVSFSDVRQRYRLLAKRYHPDTGGDQKKFVQINAAYNCVIAWLCVKEGAS